MTIVSANYGYVKLDSWSGSPESEYCKMRYEMPGIVFRHCLFEQSLFVLTFMGYNQNVILFTACSHYVINYLHKFSYPVKTGF